jgi:rhodanese-related sulfurtransferase
MKQHAHGFLNLVKEAMARVQEVTAEDVCAMLQKQEPVVLIDIREDNEVVHGTVKGAMHLGRGILERDIENAVPDKTTPIVLYCGGGYRSALSADSLQKMGYSNVLSMIGGWSGWCQKELPKDLPKETRTA